MPNCYQKILFIFILLFTVYCADAQVAVSGTVMDSLGKPVQSVSVTLKKNNGVVLAFAITNSLGAYKLQYANGSLKDTLLVEANAVSYKKQSLTVTKAVQVSNFSLHPSSTKLPNVTVKNNKPLLKKEGDTLNYDVSSFSTPQDRTIGDVIKKLPGVEVADNGQISYGGKPINRFYIDGDNLLDGKYNIATKSVPNDMVAKIQVLENHQPKNVLKDLVPSDQAAMNIVLKDKARLKIMGTGDAAFGSPDGYNVTANAMLFQKKVKFINYCKLNNVGVDLSDETINHFGFDNQPPPNLLSAGTAGTPSLFKRRYLFNNAALVNVNDMITLKNDYQLRINCYYLYDRQYQNYNYKSSFYLPTDTITYVEKQDSRTTSNAFNTQFTLTANKKDYYLNNVTVIDNTPSNVISALQATTSNNISQELNGTTTNISNKFNIIKKTPGNRVLEAYSFINHISNPSTLLVEPGLYAAQFNAGNPYAALIQQASVPTFYTDNYLNFGIISARFKQQYKIGFNYQDQHLNSLLESQQLSGTKAAVADSFTNALKWTRLKAYVQMDYSYVTSRLTLNASFPLTFQDTKYTGRLVNTHLTNLPLAPRVSFKYNIGKESYFTGSYSYNESWGNIDQVYDGYLMRSYRNFYANGPLLNENQTHSVSGSYVFKNTLKIFFFSLGGGYSKGQANTISDTRLSDVVQQSKLIPFVNLSSNSQLYGTISKYIFPLQTTIGSKVVWARSIVTQLLNGEQLQVQNDSYTFSANANTKLTSWLNMSYTGSYITYGSKQSGNSHQNAPATPKVQNWKHEVGANISFSSNFYWKLNAENYNYHIPGAADNNYTFLDASCTYKLNKLKTDIELSLTNLAGIDTYKTASLSSNSLIESSYRIRPRMAMVKFYFRF